jgi:hypothetical protein
MDRSDVWESYRESWITVVSFMMVGVDSLKKKM